MTKKYWEDIVDVFDCGCQFNWDDKFVEVLCDRHLAKAVEDDERPLLLHL